MKTKKAKLKGKNLVALKNEKAPAGRPVKGREIIVKALENEGVKVIFGYPGGASMEIHQGLTQSKKIRMVLPRHEQGGSFAAGGYARSTGEVGVCLATSGPGATNLLTGIMDAKMDSIPLIALTGQVPSAVLGSDAFQEADIVGATFPMVKHSYLVQNIADIPHIIHEAFEIAKSGRPGPVLIDIPKNVQQQEVVPDFNVKFDCPGYKPNLQPSVMQVKKAVHAIGEAKCPIIYAGGGIISARASSELRAFVKKTGIPVTTTVMGLGAYPSSDKLSLRMLGMHGAIYANIAINHADLVIALGVRFDDRVTGKLSEFCKGAKFIQVDVDASEINKNIEIDIPILTSDQWTKVAQRMAGEARIAARLSAGKIPSNLSAMLEDCGQAAFAEKLHKQVRDEWGYGDDESLTHEELIGEAYRGIRPAPGYPSQPDHTEKSAIFELLNVQKLIGIELTESFAMRPAASVSGLYFCHPQARYFNVGKLGRDQVEDYAHRKGMTVEEAERWLAPHLGYSS